MGRARGTKKDRGTGEPTPGRGAWPPELEDLQRRGGMSPDWHEATHASGRGVGSVQQSISSPLFPKMQTEDFLSLRSEPWEPERVFAILDNMDRGQIDQLSSLDPAVGALWEQERMRMDEFSRRCNLQIDWDTMERDWKRSFVGNIFNNVERNFSSAQIQYSLFALAFEKWDNSQMLQIKDCVEIMMREEPAEFSRFARRDLLPAFNDIRLHEKYDIDSAALFRAIQKAWSEYTDPPKEENLDQFEAEGWALAAEDRTLFRSSYLCTYARRLYNDISYNGSSSPEIESKRNELAWKQGVHTMLRNYLRELPYRDECDSSLQQILGDLWEPGLSDGERRNQAINVCRALEKSLLDIEDDYQEAILGRGSLSKWARRVIREVL